jgi:mannosyltransferase
MSESLFLTDRIRDNYTETRSGASTMDSRIPAEGRMAEEGLSGADPVTIEVIVPNLSLRYSGVTATNRMIAPRIAALMKTAWLGRDAPDGVSRLHWSDLWRLRRSSSGGRPIWHARRNIEMALGVMLRALGWRLALVFTSAAQRNHTALTRWLIARMDAVIATSEISASYLRRPAIVIHHGIDTMLYQPLADRAAAWRASGLPGSFGIGCFGRLRPQKGTDVFVGAMCRLLPRYPDFTAVIVGEITPDQKSFVAKLKADVEAAGLSDRIVFLGYRPIHELPLWYQRISIYAFCSRNEGFGLTLLEAMAAENGLVASRAGAAEVVVDDGETGLLVRPGDVDGMTAALEVLMRDPERARRMGQAARQRALTEFSIDTEAARIAAVYRQVRTPAPTNS